MATTNLPSSPVVLRPPLDRRRMVLGGLVVVGGIAVVAASRDVGLSPAALWEGLSSIWRFLDLMFPPRWESLSCVWTVAFETFAMAFLGTIIAVVLSFPLGFMAARNTSPHPWVRVVARAVITVARAVPDLALGAIFVRVYGIGVLAGVMALGLHAIGMVGKLFADAIEGVDQGPIDAARASGARPLQVLSTAVLSQVMPSFVAAGLYRLEINFRTSAILGYVGAGGLGVLLQQYKTFRDYDLMLGVALVVAVIAVALEVGGSFVRRRLLGVDVVSTGRTKLLRTKPKLVATGPVGGPRLRQPWTAERRAMHLLGAATVVIFVVALASQDIALLDIVREIGSTFEVFGRLVPRNLEFLNSQTIGALVESISIALVSTAVGGTAAFALSFIAARNTSPHPVALAAIRAIALAVRAVPELIVALVFVVAVGLGPLAGSLALAVGTFAFGVRLLSDAMEEVDEGPRDGVRAAGATWSQELMSAALPQALPAYVGHMLYLFDINIRASAILGIVGGGGIGFYLFGALRDLEWGYAGGVLAMVFAVVFALEQLSGWVRKQLL